MTSDTLAHLQLYQRLGLTPIPLKPRSKEPLVKWGTRWNPTSEELERWAARPSINWGVRCGESLAVLDFDSEDAYYEFVKEHRLPPDCPVVRTARGFHVWLRPQKPIRTQRLDGVEIKCLGSYVVAPPSIHPSGAPYRFKAGPNGTLPEVDLEQLLGTALLPPPRKNPISRRPLARLKQDAAERVLLEYLPGAHYIGRELAGYLDPSSESRAHVKVNLEKGVFMDWRKQRGGTVVELLHLIGAPIPPELGGMGEDDIPEYFPIWALGRHYPDEWSCGQLAVVLRQDGTPVWAGRAFCLRWKCPECAIRLKNVLKRRLSKVPISAMLRTPDRGAVPKLLARVKRSHPTLTYLRVLGESEYLLAKDASPEALAALQRGGFQLLNPNPDREDINGIVDELPHANVRRRQRRLVPSRGFWPKDGISNKHPRGKPDAERPKPPSTECIDNNSDEPALDIVVLDTPYEEVLHRLRRRGFQVADVGLGESHRVTGGGVISLYDLGEVVEVIKVRKRSPPA